MANEEKNQGKNIRTASIPAPLKVERVSKDHDRDDLLGANRSHLPGRLQATHKRISNEDKGDSL